MHWAHESLQAAHKPSGSTYVKEPPALSTTSSRYQPFGSRNRVSTKPRALQVPPQEHIRFPRARGLGRLKLGRHPITPLADRRLKGLRRHAPGGVRSQERHHRLCFRTTARAATMSRSQAMSTGAPNMKWKKGGLAASGGTPAS
jgi:hypothetical protein